ncbi:LysR substrate-binding domain-containing protein [Roseobacter sp.]|uniref:LysR substrate-binding domain-containing protein n=1 Tax=Roseobacter sp. TaxID=1907202 RepID=UPI0025EE7B49|nr:LysR substrate-binding domain-containing protein [Roseobacter sp.]
MIAPRKYLPSVTSLLCFEAVARLGSATLAAGELSLTQSAVSRQLKSLEDQLGAQLMTRAGRGLVLTPRGQEYVAEIRDILQHLARATVAAQTNPSGGTLNLAILPAFGMHWLAPRLRDFAQRHPEVTVNLSTRLAPFDFRTSSFHAAIHFGREDWPGVSYLPLMPEIVVPVCAPGLIAGPTHDPLEILAHDLLHLDTRPRGWARWFSATGREPDLPPGMVFDQFSTMAQAAIHGLGVALLPTFFAEPYLAGGELVLASSRTTESIGSYYLVWPSEYSKTGAVASFRAWLEAQTEAEKDRNMSE